MPLDTSHALCTRCGKEFPRTELSQLEDALLCAPCRPLHLEHLRKYHQDKAGRRYLYTAVDPEGRKVTDYVEAPNVGAAKYALDLRGYKNVVFHEDDISTATSQLFEQSEDHRPLEGEEMLKLVRKNSDLYSFWVFLKQNPILNLLMLAVIVAAWYRGSYFHWSAIIGYIYFFAITAFYIFATIPVICYNRLTSAVEWAQWDTVQKMVERLRKSNRYSLARIPEFELDIRAAQVLAARGQLDEGMALLKKYEEDPKVEPFLYYSRRSAVYGTANDYDNYLADTLKSAELAPNSGSMQVDVALAYILRKRDSAAAQRHLDRAREMALPDMATGWLHMIQGMIYLEDNSPEAADGELATAESFFDKFRQMPFMESCIMLVKTYRAMAATALGDSKRAKKLFEEARPWLVATDEDELVARAENALQAAQ